MNKKVLALSCIMAASAATSMMAKEKGGLGIFSYDLLRIMSESDEGKQLMKEIETEGKKFEQDVQKVSKSIADEEASLAKQKPALDEKVFADKSRQLALRKETESKKIQLRQQELASDFRMRQEALKDKHSACVAKYREENDYLVMFERNTPLLHISAKIDKTDDLLKVVNKEFAQSSASKASGSKAAAA